MRGTCTCWTHRRGAAVRWWRSADCCTEENCRLFWTPEANGGENHMRKARTNTTKPLQRFGSALCFNHTHNFAKTPLELHVGLTLVMDAGFAVLASQRKLVVHWSKSRVERTHVSRSLLQHSQQSGDGPHVHTIMRAQTSQNFGFLQ